MTGSDRFESAFGKDPAAADSADGSSKQHVPTSWAGVVRGLVTEAQNEANPAAQRRLLNIALEMVERAWESKKLPFKLLEMVVQSFPASQKEHFGSRYENLKEFLRSRRRLQLDAKALSIINDAIETADVEKQRLKFIDVFDMFDAAVEGKYLSTATLKTFVDRFPRQGQASLDFKKRFRPYKAELDRRILWEASQALQRRSKSRPSSSIYDEPVVPVAAIDAGDSMVAETQTPAADEGKQGDNLVPFEQPTVHSRASADDLQRLAEGADKKGWAGLFGRKSK